MRVLGGGPTFCSGDSISSQRGVERRGSSIRIAIVHSFYSSRQPSGENLVVDGEVGALVRAGHKVQLFAARTDDLESQVMYRIRAGLRVASGRGASPRASIQAYAPDIVLVHNLFPNFSRSWVNDLHPPVIATLHNYRPLCAKGTLLRDGQTCTLCPDGRLWSGVRYGCYRGSRLATLAVSWGSRGGPVLDPLLARADRIRVLSSLQREIYVEAGIPEYRLIVIPNFLPDDLDRGDEVARLHQRDGWLFVGRMSPEKGLIELLNSWPSGEALTMIGDGSLRPTVERLAEKRRVKLVGMLERRQVVDLMTRAKGLVFPSHYPESLPLVYIEALASGLPVLALARNAVGQAVAADGTGICIDSFESLPRAIADDIWPSLVDVCRAVFRFRYSEARFVEALTETASELIAM